MTTSKGESWEGMWAQATQGPHVRAVQTVNASESEHSWTLQLHRLRETDYLGLALVACLLSIHAPTTIPVGKLLAFMGACNILLLIVSQRRKSGNN